LLRDRVRLLEAKRLVLLWTIATDDSGTPPAGEAIGSGKRGLWRKCLLVDGQVNEMGNGTAHPLGSASSRASASRAGRRGESQGAVQTQHDGCTSAMADQGKAASEQGGMHSHRQRLREK
jgi:hypothetical protein